MPSFIYQNLTKINAVTGCTFACICHTVFRMFSCLQINWQTFYLRQVLKFHPFDWLIEIYLQTEGQGTHHKMVSLQLMPGFPFCFLNCQNTKHANDSLEQLYHNLKRIIFSLSNKWKCSRTFAVMSLIDSVIKI